LRRIPASLDRRQVLYLDGIRHAAELADFAYARLVRTLTELALTGGASGEPNRFTAPFLDAWAVVDSIDRLRGLLYCMPGMQEITPADGRRTFSERMQVIRDLRNVADHVPTRVDYILANNSAALGILGWCTLVNASDIHACTIYPGTLVQSTDVPMVNPCGKAFTPPSDLITLKAGEYSGSLSSTMEDVRQVISALEASFGAWLRDHGLEGQPAGSDMLAIAVIDIGGSQDEAVITQP